jgi:hypothetical protein
MQCRAAYVARFAQVETGKLIRSEAAFRSLYRLRVKVGSIERDCWLDQPQLREARGVLKIP